jgi:fluoride exporter
VKLPRSISFRKVAAQLSQRIEAWQRLCLDRFGKLIRNDGWTMKILLVMMGGSLGALSRYGISLLAARLFGTRFPWGTLAVNLSGCFLIGLAFALAERGLSIMNPAVRLFFVTGFLGALTTFSTYGLETILSMREGSHLVTVANFLSNNVIGLALVFLGMLVGRLR